MFEVVMLFNVFLFFGVLVFIVIVVFIFEQFIGIGIKVCVVSCKFIMFDEVLKGKKNCDKFILDNISVLVGKILDFIDLKKGCNVGFFNYRY